MALHAVILIVNVVNTCTCIRTGMLLENNYVIYCPLVSRPDINLQEKCLDAISLALQSKLDLEKLPLPDHMKDRLKLYSYKK